MRRALQLLTALVLVVLSSGQNVIVVRRAASEVCGNGTVAGAETCDDGGTAAGDGCSATCTLESGYYCAGAPSVCAYVASITGWLNFEDGTAGGTNSPATYTIGATECSKGDTTAARTAGTDHDNIEIHSTGTFRAAHTRGIYTAEAGANSGRGLYSLDLASIIGTTDGTICLDWKNTTEPGSAVGMFETSGQDLSLIYDNSADRLRVLVSASYLVGGTATDSVDPAGAYVIQLSYDFNVGIGTDFVKVWINKSSTDTPDFNKEDTYADINDTSFVFGSTSSANYVVNWSYETLVFSTASTGVDCYKLLSTMALKNAPTGSCP